MADGILCKHCGYQETDHTFDPEGFPKVRIKGYKKSLRNCRGYEPEDEELADELAKEAMQRELRGRGIKDWMMRD